jgi:pimeloyl-ACP methyl ester carboxylesterase
MGASPEDILGARRIVVPANGLEFEVFEAGEGDRLALLLHGFPQHAIVWRHQLSFLVDRGYRVWAVNQRGYGGSSRPPSVEDYRLDKLTGDVAGLIDASGAKSVTLLGHDWGGAVAWIFAIHRVRRLDRLVVFNIPHPMCFRRELKKWGQRLKSWYVAFFQLPYAPEWALSLGRGAAFDFILRHDARSAGAFSEDALAVYRDNMSAPGAMRAMLNWYRAAGRDLLDARDLDQPIDTPTLLIWGEKDSALSLSCLNGTDHYVHNLWIERLPNISHWVLEDAPDQVNRILGRFL